MPVSTEKNFDEKFNLFKEWLTQQDNFKDKGHLITACLLYTSPSPRDRLLSRMPSSA